MQNFEDLWSLVQMGFFWGGGVFGGPGGGERVQVCAIREGRGRGVFVTQKKEMKGIFGK